MIKNDMISRIQIILVIVIFQTCHMSCATDCDKPQIVHLDFCDFLNDISSQLDRERSERTFQEKRDHFIINDERTACLSPLIVGEYLSKDEFAQREIHNGYYRLIFTFYKKSPRTEGLLKEKSSRYLDYCNDDIFVEFEWTEGQPTDTIYYQNGMIKGSEKIHLIQKADSVK